MLKIGLTGGIGSGKTTVSRIFKLLGIPVFNADETAKKIMEQDAGLMAAIKKAFGENAYSNGRLNRKYLAAVVFNDGYKLALLNALTHPVTIAASEKWMREQTAPYAVKEAALMFESAAASGVDYIVGVFAPVELRIRRVVQRDGLSRQEVMARMDRQIDEDLKMKLCDFVVQNTGQQLLIPQVLKLHEQFIRMAEGNGLLS